MREILFHGKRVDNGEWVEGYYVYDESGQTTEEPTAYICYLNQHPCGWMLIPYKVFPESVGQYTGMNEFVAADSSYNKPLFEGDIVELWSTRRPYYSSPKSQYDGDVKVRAVICFRRGSWTLDYNNNYNKSLTKLKGREEDERTVEGYWDLYYYSPRNSNEEWLREHNFKWHDIKKIGTVFENADLLEG